MRVLLTMPLLVTAVLAQDAAHDRFVTTLQQHAVAIGAAGGLPASWRTVATRTEGGRQTTVRTFVRRSPFALRRELETEGRSHVSLTDGHLAWHGDGRPLPAAQARELLDTALLDGLLYLDPDRVAGGPDTDTPWPLREHAALPPDLSGPRTSNWIASRSPSGRLLQLHFDAADHQLLEAADATPGGSRSWTRYGLPRRLASLSLPTLRASGRIGEPTTAVWQVEAVEIDVTLPDDLFAGCPQVETPRVQSLGQMLTCVHATPGNAYLVLPAVLVNGNPVEALVDTGASRSALVPRLATTLRVPAGGPIAAHAFAGSVQMQSAWLDEERAGERVRLQRTVAVSHLPGIYPRPRDRPYLLALAQACVRRGAAWQHLRDGRQTHDSFGRGSSCRTEVQAEQRARWRYDQGAVVASFDMVARVEFEQAALAVETDATERQQRTGPEERVVWQRCVAIEAAEVDDGTLEAHGTDVECRQWLPGNDQLLVHGTAGLLATRTQSPAGDPGRRVGR